MQAPQRGRETDDEMTLEEIVEGNADEAEIKAQLGLWKVVTIGDFKKLSDARRSAFRLQFPTANKLVARFLGEEPLNANHKQLVDAFRGYHKDQGIDSKSIEKAVEALTSNQDLLDQWTAAFAKVNCDAPRLGTAIPHLEMHKLFLDKELRDEIAAAWNGSSPSPLVRRITLSKGEWCIQMSRKELFYREKHYDALWEQVKAMQPEDRLLLFGNPGIGKSWSLNALLMRHLAVVDHDPVVVRDLKGWHYFDRDGYRLFETARALITNLCSCFPDKKQRVLLLHDCKTRESIPWREEDVLYAGFATVLAASPHWANYKNFVKHRAPRFYMPPWSREELACVLPAGTVTDDLYFKLGGVLRWYYDIPANVISYIDEAIENYDFKDETKPKSDATSKVVTFYPLEKSAGCFDYSAHETPLSFVSGYVAKKWTTMRMARDLKIVQDRLFALVSNTATRLGAGYAFEAYALTRLESENCNYRVKTLGSARSPIALKSELLPLPQAMTAKMVADASGIAPSQNTLSAVLYKPIASNFPCFDGFIVYGSQLYLLQVTLGERHPVNQKVEEIYAQLKGSFTAQNTTLVWIVDKESKLNKPQPADVQAGSACGKWFNALKQVRLEFPIYGHRARLGDNTIVAIDVGPVPTVGSIAQQIRDLEGELAVQVSKANGTCELDAKSQCWKIEQ